MKASINRLLYWISFTYWVWRTQWRWVRKNPAPFRPAPYWFVDTVFADAVFYIGGGGTDDELRDYFNAAVDEHRLRQSLQSLPVPN